MWRWARRSYYRVVCFKAVDDHREANGLAGDCAELFDYCEEESIESKIKLLLQMSLVLIWGSSLPSFSYAISCQSHR